MVYAFDLIDVLEALRPARNCSFTWFLEINAFRPNRKGAHVKALLNSFSYFSQFLGLQT